MEGTAQSHPPYRELQELLDAASFSLETAHMALGIGRRGAGPQVSLADRLLGGDEEEKEAGGVALDALKSAATAYADLAGVLAEPDMEALSIELGFWSAFDWCSARLFNESVRHTSQRSLRQELTEARRLTLKVLEHMRQRLAPVHSVH